MFGSASLVMFDPIHRLCGSGSGSGSRGWGPPGADSKRSTGSGGPENPQIHSESASGGFPVAPGGGGRSGRGAARAESLDPGPRRRIGGPIPCPPDVFECALSMPPTLQAHIRRDPEKSTRKGWRWHPPHPKRLGRATVDTCGLVRAGDGLGRVAIERAGWVPSGLCTQCYDSVERGGLAGDRSRVREEVGDLLWELEQW